MNLPNATNKGLSLIEQALESTQRVAAVGLKSGMEVGREERERLERENAALRRDAGRYRWLRERPSLIGWDWWQPQVSRNVLITPEFMDSAIDAELARHRKEGAG
jgi:hypothetical protein